MSTPTEDYAQDPHPPTPGSHGSPHHGHKPSHGSGGGGYGGTLLDPIKVGLQPRVDAVSVEGM